MCLIREQPGYRRDAFLAGLQAAGLDRGDDPRGMLVTWNRYGHYARIADRYEAAGGVVLVAENGPLGRDWRGGHWYTLCRGRHNTLGTFPVGGPERWDGWSASLEPWRTDGEHVLVLPARGIGSPPVVQPSDWLERTLARLQRITRRPIKVRAHPGESAPPRPLEADLHGAWCCVTWGSGAALKALCAGVPVFHDYPDWIGQGAAQRLGEDIEQPSLGDRLPMLRTLAWSMWNTDEIATGEPFRRLLA